MECVKNVIHAFLDNLVVPILVVNDKGHALYANSNVRHLLGKENYEILGELGGDIFECIHSKKPGGCGGTKHCKACTIRNSVEHTLTTGESLFEIPATLKVQPSQKKYVVSNMISNIRKTNKNGEYIVYLTIKDFSKSVGQIL